MIQGSGYQYGYSGAFLPTGQYVNFTDVSVFIRGEWYGSRYHGALSQFEVLAAVEACRRRNGGL